MATQWNYILNGQTLGPVPEDQLKGMLAAGTLKADDLVWREGMTGWLAIKQVPELMSPNFQAFNPAPGVAANNPYAAPKAELHGAVMGNPASTGISPTVVELLRQTKPWARLLAVLGFIGIGFLLLGSFAMLALGSSLGQGLPAGFGIGMMVAYMFMAGIQLPAVIFLNRYASRIGTLVNSNTSEDLERALAAQKSFWRYLGILTLIILCIYVLIILLAIIGGVVGMSGLFK